MTSCLILTSRQAATLHLEAIDKYHEALRFTQAFRVLPAVANQFYIDAYDWRKMGQQIEEHNPEFTRHDWTCAGMPE